MVKPKLRALFQEYFEYHKDPVNVAIHKVAVPAILFHVVAMLDWIALVGPVSVGVLVVGLAGLWYLTMAPRYAPWVVSFSILCLFVGRRLPWEIVLAIAVVAWVAQLIGHARFERRAPAFKDNLVQLLVGPAYVAALLLGDWPPPVDPAPVDRAQQDVGGS